MPSASARRHRGMMPVGESASRFADGDHFEGQRGDFDSMVGMPVLSRRLDESSQIMLTLICPTRGSPLPSTWRASAMFSRKLYRLQFR